MADVCVSSNPHKYLGLPDKKIVLICFLNLLTWFMTSFSLSLRIEVVLVGIALAFLGFEIIFSIAAIFTFKR